jgi:muconate cycloisomerase
MRVSDIDVSTLSVEREFGNVSAVKEIEESVFALVRVTADDGTTGVGEISDVEHPEAMPSAADIEAEFESFLVGEDPREINRLTAEMYDAVDFGPFEFHSFQQLALAGLDTALYDLVGNYYGVPAYQLLGGRTRDVPVCWVVYTRQEAGALDDLRAEVRTRVDEGFSAFKLKVGEVDPEVDAERIRTVREIAGEDADVFADAQGVWGLEEAIENVERFEAAGMDGIETPVGHHDGDVRTAGYYYDVPLVPEELATVRAATDAEIFEHVLDPAFGLALAAEDAVDVFTVEVCAGGISRAARILSIAEGAGIDARLGSTGELGPGTLAAAALGTAATGVTYPCDLAGPRIYRESVLESGLEYRDGRLRPAESPGFGFDLRSGVFE